MLEIVLPPHYRARHAFLPGSDAIADLEFKQSMICAPCDTFAGAPFHALASVGRLMRFDPRIVP